MKTLAVFLSDDLTIRRFNVAFRQQCNVRAFSRISELKTLASNGALLASVVDMSLKRNIQSDSPVDVITKLHSAHPVVPIIGYVDFIPERARDIVAAAHAGAADIVLRDIESLEIAAKRILEMESAVDVGWQVEARLNGRIPAHLKEFVLYSVKNSANGATVDSAARHLRKTRKTIANWLAAAGLPAPYKIIGWGRVLMAAKLLEDEHRSIENVARQMKFLNGTALRGMIRRYLHLTPDEVRAGGGFQLALEKFILALDQVEN